MSAVSLPESRALASTVDDERTLRRSEPAAAQQAPSLSCTPDSVDLFCETSSQVSVRVATSDRRAGVPLSAFGFDTSRVLVTPTRATTNADGHADIVVRCQGGAFCPCETTIQFAADTGGYAGTSLQVDCEHLPSRTATHDQASAPGLLGYPAAALQHAGHAHGVLVQAMLTLRREARGDPAQLLRHALAEAAASGSLSRHEARALAALAPVAQLPDAPARLARCRDVQHRLMRDGAAPLALQIAAIATDSAAAALLEASIPIGEDILGAVVGGAIGALFGNPFIGAIVGAALLSSAEANPAQ